MYAVLLVGIVGCVSPTCMLCCKCCNCMPICRCDVIGSDVELVRMCNTWCIMQLPKCASNPLEPHSWKVEPS